jgi:hypothetical protein
MPDLKRIDNLLTNRGLSIIPQVQYKYIEKSIVDLNNSLLSTNFEIWLILTSKYKISVTLVMDNDPL